MYLATVNLTLRDENPRTWVPEDNSIEFCADIMVNPYYLGEDARSCVEILGTSYDVPERDEEDRTIFYVTFEVLVNHPDPGMAREIAYQRWVGEDKAGIRREHPTGVRIIDKSMGDAFPV